MIALPRAWVESPVGELRSHKPHGVAKINWEFQDEDSRRLNKARGSPEQAPLWDCTGDHCEAGSGHKTLSAHPGVWFSGKRALNCQGHDLTRLRISVSEVEWRSLLLATASFLHVRYTGWPGGGHGGPGDREKRTCKRWRLGCCWWTGWVYC